MSDVRKYFVARGPFRIPTPGTQEGGIVELDSAVAAQFVREGTLNPSGFVCDAGGNPVDEKPEPPAADSAQSEPVVVPTPPAADSAKAADGAPAVGEK